ncbi:16S rRNA (cytidine(1402)-2'-O)-methyltransferase [Pokkaliibacter plantistimulans]|uniref:Ribosomal RNA small subunit methyltransferase I n=1 Tax=Proteobacteria bacterium 228 TaxID=2083153 RepID=A0A2S5KJ38_9PROT|nr:16S rRNA (cytidine(1402)-2'-O)-methyltransferase [Pokkaliibacter plantistimulans]PPC74798.1 16S rRNA (cytidine(1402)-2'-O)-methyltransferase [Pokkaliibacter plantistimulans]
MSEQALYIVATPIGNLEDLSPRAVATLSSVGLIAAEDTRHSQRLLSHFNIRTPVWAVHDHNERKQADAIVQRLMGGESVALVSDAGTPLISDPGYHLVKEVRRAGFKVVPIPGPCAMVTALCAAGLPTDKFVFEGFLPAKAQARQAALEKVRDEARTLVFYESPHRILATLQAMVEVLGEGRAMVMARELTKTFETFLSGSIAEVLAEVEADHNQQKGEMVLMVQGHSVSVAGDDDLDAEGVRVMQILLESLSISQAASTGAKILNQPRKKLYQWALARQSD